MDSYNRKRRKVFDVSKFSEQEINCLIPLVQERLADVINLTNGNKTLEIITTDKILLFPKV